MSKARADASKRRLSKQQTDAIKLLSSGCAPRYTALVLKIKLSEINKWMKQDEIFRNMLAESLRLERNDEGFEMADSKPKPKGLRNSHEDHIKVN